MFSLLLGFLLPLPQTATTYDFPPYTQVTAGTPLRIDACESSQNIVRGIVRTSTLAYGIAFTILGAEPATDVRIRFEYQNRDRKVVGESQAAITGDFTPGATIYRTHRYGGDFHDRRVLHDVALVVCSPEYIRFKNGSSWGRLPTTLQHRP